MPVLTRLVMKKYLEKIITRKSTFPLNPLIIKWVHNAKIVPTKKISEPRIFEVIKIKLKLS